MQTNFAPASQWASMRIAVGSALFVGYLIVSIGYWYSMFFQQSKPIIYINMRDLSSKMYLFGLGALLSMSYLQGSIYMAIFTYFNMAFIIIMVLMTVVNKINQQFRTKMYLMFYLLIFAWYMGIVADLYKTVNQANNQ